MHKPPQEVLKEEDTLENKPQKKGSDSQMLFSGTKSDDETMKTLPDDQLKQDITMQYSFN